MMRARTSGGGLQMHAERIDAGVAHAGEPCGIIGRLALALDGQVDRGFDGGGAFCEDGRAAILARRRAGRHHHVTHAIKLTAARATSASCAGVLRSVVRPAANDWPMAQNWQVLYADV